MTNERSNRPDVESPPAVTLGGYDSALSIARSLGRRGVPVVALGVPWTVGTSRYVRRIVNPPGPEPQEAWLRWLLGADAADLAGAVLLPCDDDGLEMIARHADLLALRFHLPETNADVTLDLLDKEKTYELARGAGIPTPRIWTASTPEELRALLPEIRYPCGVKPRHGHLFRRQFGRHKLFLVHTEEELLTRFGEVHRAGLGSIVTEIVPGQDAEHVSCWTYLDATGTPLFLFTKRKLRQHPPAFGLGTFHVVEWVPVVAELGVRFARSIGARGIAVTEFKRDPRDGVFKLMELNPRFPTANEIAHRAGVDIAGIAYDRALGRPVPAIRGYREGTRLWDPYHDWMALAAYRARGELTFGRWVRSLLHRTAISHLDAGDPMPFLSLAARVFARKTFPAPATEPDRPRAMAAFPRDATAEDHLRR